MSPRLSARDVSILSLLAETSQISDEQFDRLAALATSDEVRTAARVLRTHDWDNEDYPADLREFARAVFLAAEARRQGREQEAVAAS